MAQSTRVIPEEIVFDAWTAVSYKRALGNRATGGNSWLAPVWVGDEHARRLMAYKILQSYVDNSSRYFLETSDLERIKNRREYGDADVIVQAVMDSVIGDDYKLVIDGVANGDQRAQDLQQWLIDWAKAERFGQHLLEVESDAVSLGDGVYTVSWSNSKSRPRIKSYDPGFYFPVLDPNADEQDYPQKIHVAWEIDDGDKTKLRVRRITWRLGYIMPLTDTTTGEFALDAAGTPLLTAGDSYGADGLIYRQYPWNDEPVPLTCYLSDAVYTLERMKRSVDDLTPATAEYQLNEDGQVLRDLDLLIDFIPVVHIPNTVALREHYGQSSLAKVLQVLDDLQGTDTDLQGTSAIVGSPPIVVKGGTLATDSDGKVQTYGPGTVYNVDAAGGLDVMDTSTALDPLTKLTDHLLQRLSVNSRVPESVLGRIKPSEVPSGIALALSFGPLEKMVRKMRIARQEKYPVLLKFIMRLALLGGAIPAGDIPAAQLEFGSYLPSDKATTVQNVSMLRQASPPLISLQTSLQMLVEAGFPIDDAAAELQRIEDERAQAQQQALDTMKAQADIAAANAPKTNSLATTPQQGSSPAARPGT